MTAPRRETPPRRVTTSRHVTASRTAWRVFRHEIEAAERYERGLLLKAGICLLIVAVVAVLRQTFLI